MCSRNEKTLYDLIFIILKATDFKNPSAVNVVGEILKFVSLFYTKLPKLTVFTEYPQPVKINLKEIRGQPELEKRYTFKVPKGKIITFITIKGKNIRKSRIAVNEFILAWRENTGNTHRYLTPLMFNPFCTCSIHIWLNDPDFSISVECSGHDFSVDPLKEYAFSLRSEEKTDIGTKVMSILGVPSLYTIKSLFCEPDNILMWSADGTRRFIF